MNTEIAEISAQKSVNHQRNTGLDLDIGFIGNLRVNRSAVERRCSALGGRRTVKKENQAAWLLKAVTCMDLTTLSGDDTPARVRRLCAKARQPISPALEEQLGVKSLNLHTGAVCVYHEMVPIAVEALTGTGIPVAAVSTGFPAGLSPHRLKVMEIEESVAAGADEIDIVISRRHVLNADWNALYQEMQDFRRACGDAHVKAILATGRTGNFKQRGPRILGLHDGRRRFYQDIHGQRKRQRYASVYPGYVACHSRFLCPDRDQNRLQAGWRNFQGERQYFLSVTGQGRTGRYVVVT